VAANKKTKENRTISMRGAFEECSSSLVYKKVCPMK